MDAIEQAIRNAFAKGNPEDAAFREKVYRSAYAALDKALQSNTTLSAEAAETRRRNLIAAISAIESEFIPAVEPAPPAAEIRRDPDPRQPALGEPPRAERREPGFSSVGDTSDWPAAPQPEHPRNDPMPDVDAGDGSAVGGRAERTMTPLDLEPRRRPWGLIAGLLVFFLVIGLAFWTAAELGLVGSSGTGGTTATANGGNNAGEDAAPRRPGEAGGIEDWITVFSPSNPTSVAAPAGTTAEVVESGGEQTMRISSGTSGAALLFDVGQGVLERIAGKRAVFDIVARAGEGRETQISVSCNFGDLGDCGRNRYVVGADRAEFLFEIDMPARSPGAAGVIAIVSDVSNQGNPLELYEIRVTIAE